MGKLPVITLTGPRQSGKTTLAQNLFPHYTYLSLEDPDIRLRATHDPKAFFKSNPNSLILDEIQRAPELTSYLQTMVDEPNHPYRYILTGSHQLLLMEAVKQSLAGRTRVFELLPLSRRELPTVDSLNETLFNGGYPRIHHKKLDPTSWCKDYFQLYVERDLKLIVQILDLSKFELFLRLLAGRVGQLLNYSSLANEVGISVPTVKSWIEALKVSYICFELRPYYRNLGKRLVKTPKIYFFDSGLLCYLLRLTKPEQIDFHPLRGQIFENFVVSEKIKDCYNHGLESNYYFWRDQSGREIDLIRDDFHLLTPTEIKISATFQPSFTTEMEYFSKLLKNQKTHNSEIIYTGEKNFLYGNYHVRDWRDF